MTPPDDELDAWAGEYVLGLLTGEERDRFERRLTGDPRLNRLVIAWQVRLQPLIEDIEPVEPRPQLWQRIEATLAAPGALQQKRSVYRRSRRIRWWDRVAIWRGWAIGATALAAALAAFLVVRPSATPGPRLIAVLNASGGQPGVLFTTELPGSGYAARAIVDISASPQAHELWLLPGANAAPISLGLLTPDATTRRPLPAGTAPLLKAGAAVAVSEEPPGGSPTGQPTGPVVYVGTLVEDEG